MGSYDSNLSEAVFNVATINCCTESEGPHKRMAIWFQGCDLACCDCCNQELRPFAPRRIMRVGELVSVVRAAMEDFGIEGVTYLGGEPTRQSALPLLTARIKGLGLGIICFTGRQFEEVKDMLCGCDMVIDGIFDKTKLDTSRRIIGSTNQRIIHLTDRYINNERWFYDNVLQGELNVTEYDLLYNGDVLGVS